jgi:hypothetical protein
MQLLYNTAYSEVDAVEQEQEQRDTCTACCMINSAARGTKDRNPRTEVGFPSTASNI